MNNHWIWTGIYRSAHPLSDRQSRWPQNRRLFFPRVEQICRHKRRRRCRGCCLVLNDEWSRCEWSRCSLFSDDCVAPVRRRRRRRRCCRWSVLNDWNRCVFCVDCVLPVHCLRRSRWVVARCRGSQSSHAGCWNARLPGQATRSINQSFSQSISWSIDQSIN